MTSRRLRRRSKALALALLWAAAPLAALGQSAPQKCPPGYENLCSALVKPPAQSGIGSVGGTSGKSAGNTREQILENKDYEVQTPGSAQMNMSK